jgi:hypothetical protein
MKYSTLIFLPLHRSCLIDPFFSSILLRPKQFKGKSSRDKFQYELCSILSPISIGCCWLNRWKSSTLKGERKKSTHKSQQNIKKIGKSGFFQFNLGHLECKPIFSVFDVLWMNQGVSMD